MAAELLRDTAFWVAALHPKHAANADDQISATSLTQPVAFCT
jgi:hypothetical protein